MDGTSAEGATRADLREAKRIIVKVGSRSLLDGSGRFASLARQLEEARSRGQKVAIVSSGAIGVGRQVLGLSERPTTMPQLQAVAAVGQSRFMRTWEDAFVTFHTPTAQILLTHADFAARERYLNARLALEALFGMGAVPIINENDTVSVDEIRFGDNDQLAAMTAALVGADLLVLLSNVDGIYDASGQVLSTLAEDAAVVAHRTVDDLGRGGIESKVDAARRANRSGVPVVVANAKDDAILARICRGEDVGTLCPPTGAKLASRKHWIGFTLKPKGDLWIDGGAAEALGRGKSLLPAGVVGVRGTFEAGDAVRIRRQSDGREVARGLSRYSVREAAALCGARSADLETRLGRAGDRELVHRNDMVLV